MNELEKAMCEHAKQLEMAILEEFRETGNFGCPKDWLYRNIPLTPTDNWEKMIDIIGEGNYKVLAMTIRDVNDVQCIRGQLMVSPTGMENLRFFATHGAKQ